MMIFLYTINKLYIRLYIENVYVYHDIPFLSNIRVNIEC